MALYVDGFVLPLKKSKLRAYRAMAVVGSKVWRKHGALEYRECVGEDFSANWGLSFPKGIRAKRGETVVIAWIVYKSRKHRDVVNQKVMNDPTLAKFMEKRAMPFDMKRMMYGGFEVLVGA